LQIAREVADLVTPTGPKGISYDFDQNVAASVLADPDKVFRILFNLVSNARGGGSSGPSQLLPASEI
jgi:signal transduction histidine kinase